MRRSAGALLGAVLLGVTGAASGAGPAPGASVELTFADPAIVESSGLVVDDSSGTPLFVTTNDSGDTGRVFVVDDSGATVGVSTWSQDPVDVEALAPAGPGEVWVADIGDNDAERDSVSVARVRVGVGDVTQSPLAQYELAYPRGARDAETLMVDPAGRLIVVTKGLLGGEFLRSGKRLDPDRPNPLTSVGVALPIATDGAFLPDGRHLVVRSYGSAVFYAYPSLEEVARLRLPDQQQGEGIAVDASGTVFLSSEGERSQVLRLRLPRDVRRALAPPAPQPEPSGGTPTRDGASADAGPSTSGDEDVVTDAPTWWWGIGGLVGLGLLLLARRARRPRG